MLNEKQINKLVPLSELMPETNFLFSPPLIRVIKPCKRYRKRRKRFPRVTRKYLHYVALNQAALMFGQALRDVKHEMSQALQTINEE